MVKYALTAENVCKSVELDKNKLDIIKNVNFFVKEGEYVAIMGPSGSGKSTLLGILSCIDKQTAGKVMINNVDVTNLNKDELTEFRNNNIGIVFQSFNLIPVLNAGENIEVPLFFSKKQIDWESKVAERADRIVYIKDGELYERNSVK